MKVSTPTMRMSTGRTTADSRALSAPGTKAGRAWGRRYDPTHWQDASMRLYMAVPIDYAREVIRDGFTPTGHYREGGGYVAFRDLASTGLTRSITTESHQVETPDGIGVQFSGGPLLSDYIGDFTLTIDVPAEDVMAYEAHDDDPQGWPFREFWIPPELANRHRSTLRVVVPDTDEEITPPTMLLDDHAVIVTERFAAFGGQENPAPVAALCTCGERWRWDGKGDPRETFPAWIASHA
jgi:hypothetical protein